MEATNKNIVKICNKIYNKEGQSGVFDYINKLSRIKYNLLGIKLEKCKSCEVDSYAANHTCLVCGQPTESQTTMKKFLEGIDFKDLKAQKFALISVQDKIEKRLSKQFTQKEQDALEGILCLIDAIQDIAVDEYEYPTQTVFRHTREKK